MRSKTAVLVAFAALLAAPACGNLLDPAAAVVYGEKIPMDEVQALLDEYVSSASFKQLAAQGDAGALKREYEQGRLSALIIRAVLTPAAEERDIEVTEEEVQEQITSIAETEFENASQFEEALKEQGLTRADLEEIVADRLLEEELRAAVIAEAEPSAEDLRAYYDEHPEEFQQTRSQHILVAKEKLARRLADRLKVASSKVGKLFASLARKHSTDPSAKDNGGNLGFQPPGSFVEPFENAVADLEEGEISDPVQTDFGWHVIRVLARRTASFEQARPQIESQLATTVQDEAWQDFLRGLFDEADVEVNPRYGEFDQELGRVVDADADDIPAGEEPAPAESPTVPEIPVPTG